MRQMGLRGVVKGKRVRTTVPDTNKANPASGDLVHHSDRGLQYVSIRYTQRLADASIEPSVGSVVDSYDSALAKEGDRVAQD